MLFCLSYSSHSHVSSELLTVLLKSCFPSHRTCWNRVFCMSLFVEHVLLGTSALMPEVEKLVKNHTLLLAKVSWDVIFTSFLFASAVLAELSHLALLLSSAAFWGRFRHEDSSDFRCSDQSTVQMQGGNQQQALQVVMLRQSAQSRRNFAYVNIKSIAFNVLKTRWRAVYSILFCTLGWVD